MTDQEVRDMAEAHYDFIAKVLDYQMKIQRVLYVEAFVHGHKHAMQEVKQEKTNEMA